MSAIKQLINTKFAIFLFALARTTLNVETAIAQCDTGMSPTYTNSCSTDYYTAITASGTGVTSTITLTGTSCTGVYINDYATQGITATPGSTVNLSVTRDAHTYRAYLGVYVDWTNSGTFTTADLVGTAFTFTTSLVTTVYSFTIPTSGVVTGTNLHMRVMMSELVTGAPCNASYGQTADFYINVACPPSSITVSPAKDSFCAGGSGINLTASGAPSGSAYSWAPPAGLSATTGAVVAATPSVTTTYSVTVTASGCEESATSLVKVLANPIPVVTFNGKTFRTAATYMTYQWYEDSIAISGATHDTVLAHSDGHYAVKVTDSNGCTATSLVYPLAHLAVENINNGPFIRIYPNPANNVINIEAPIRVNARINSMDGRLVAKQDDASSIDISALSSGIYFIELFDENNNRLTIQKLIKN